MENKGISKQEILYCIHNKPVQLKTSWTCDNCGESIKPHIRQKFCPFCGNHINSHTYKITKAVNIHATHKDCGHEVFVNYTYDHTGKLSHAEIYCNECGTVEFSSLNYTILNEIPFPITITKENDEK